MMEQSLSSQSRCGTTIAAALGLFVIWTLATWLLEGRIETLLRPEAVVDRVVYAVVANLLIGIVAAVVVLRFTIRRYHLERSQAGFGIATPSPIRLLLALALGFAFYILQGAPSLNPIVLANAFAQVLVVSAAEIVVCWAAVGASIEAAMRPHGRVIAWIGAALVASALFGIYHFAHSAPFNTVGMVALLTVVGLVTSVFFLVARDVYAAIIFHNFLGTFGVVQALDASGQMGAFATLQPPLLLMAAVTIAVLALADWRLLRRATPA